MTSTVHYKFKSQKDYDSLGFDGMFISVGDLKRQIAEKKGLAGDRNMELQLTNAQNDEEYADDSTMVWKNTSVIVKRVPVARPGAVGSEVGSTTEKKVVYVAPPQPLPTQPHQRRRPYGHPQHTGSMTWTADGANTPADGDKEPADASIAALVSDASAAWETEKAAASAAGRGGGRGRGLGGRGLPGAGAGAGAATRAGRRRRGTCAFGVTSRGTGSTSARRTATRTSRL